MWLFVGRIEHTLACRIQRLHYRDPGEHGRSILIDDPRQGSGLGCTVLLGMYLIFVVLFPGPAVRASVPILVPLAFIEHAEPTVYAICRPDVSGSLGVRIIVRSSHRVIR